VLLGSLIVATLAASPQDIVLVTIDTLRADHVGAYGSAAGATPALDALGRSGVIVDEAVVQAPQTRPSHASLLTGLLPFQHGLRDNASPPLARSVPTLASSLRKAGYATAAFIAAYPVSRASGLDSGFEVFDDPFGGGADFLAGAGERNERPAQEVVSAALSWMAKPSTRPRFVWLHFFEPHFPYEPPAPFASRFPRSLYDGEVATADAQLRRLLDRYPPGPSRLVVVTSDHGEGLGDHGEDEHHLFVYDSTLRVPLAFAGASLTAGRRVKGQFRSIDLMPTILDLVSIQPPRVTGVSRAPNLRSGAVIPDNQSYAESLYGALHFGFAPVRALRGEGFKFIDTPRPELYRVAEDPGELTNLAKERAPLAALMRGHLQKLHGEDATRAAAAAPADPESLERLAGLGYVGGAAPAAGAAPAGGFPDPKDRLDQYNRYSRGVNAAIAARRADDAAAVVRILEPLAREFSNQYTVVSYLGQALLETRRFAEAVPHLEKARDLSPKAGPTWARLAEALVGAGREEEALGAADKGLLVSPRNTNLIRLRAALLTRAGRAGEAAAFLEKSMRDNPSEGVLAAELSSVRRNAGDLAAADTLSARAIQLSPRSADAWISRGLALGALARSSEAAAAFAKAREFGPRLADGWFYGAAVLIQQGDRESAIRLLDKAEELEPGRPGLREARMAALSIPRPAVQASPTGPAKGSLHLRIIRCQTEAAASEARRRVMAGQDFAAVARELSTDPSRAQGGDLGFVSPADLQGPLRVAAESLAPGAVSTVVPSGRGFVIVKREP
jgi:choline-sulfatase